MNSYVVDASVIASVFVTDSYTAHAKSLVHRIGVLRLFAPETLHAEIANTLWKHVRFNGLPIAHALGAIADLRGLGIPVVDTQWFYERAMLLGATHQLSIYDCIHIALAERLRCPLISLDAKQTLVAAAAGVTAAITNFA
jgi:predicted nucleic acid-binding protein